MVFTRLRSLLTTVATLGVFLVANDVAPAEAWLAPLVAKGNKLFSSETGEEFRIKGMAYYPRPNGGELSKVTGYDWTTDDHESVWAPHLEVMKDLGVNAIRLYSVDPTQSHDKFMCAASEAGIYVIVGMVAPCLNCAVPEAEPPKCYPPELYERIQLVYNAFAVYDNTLGFSVGNENNLPNAFDKTGTVSAPCVKALLRDTKAYATSCAGDMRQVPIGLDLADTLPRELWFRYYDCVVDGKSETSADWIGTNPYVECDPLTNTEYAKSAGLQKLMADYNNVSYSRPLMFGEYGCNKGENTVDGWTNQRTFYDAKWMNEEPEMTANIIGGNVFEFTTETANLEGEKKILKTPDAGKYGVGYFTPEDCDHDAIPCVFNPYPEFKNLKTAYTTTKPSTVTMDSYKPTRNQILACPAKLSLDLPETPSVKNLACSVRQPKCGSKTSNAGDATIKKRVVDDRDPAPNSGPVDVATSQGGDSSTPGGKNTPGASPASGSSSATSAAAATAAIAVALAATVL